MIKRNAVSLFWGTLFSLLTCSCVSWKPGYETPLIQKSHRDTTALLKKAEQLEATADTASTCLELITAYQTLAESSPQNFLALWKTGHYHMLYGAAYAETKAEKKTRYIEAAQYFERAMATNKDFQRGIEQGKNAWELADRLTLKEVPAMGYWSMAVFYTFGECLSPVGRMMNTRWISRIAPFMDRVDALDPNWEGGAMDFSRAVYYIALPERFGGDKLKSEQLFASAIEKGPDYLVNRWGRAKYLYSITGPKSKYISDLKWVIAQDPHQGRNPYPWNIYVQRDAQKMLNHVDHTFKN